MIFPATRTMEHGANFGSLHFSRIGAKVNKRLA